MRRLVCALLASAPLLFAATGSQAASNLLINGSFEDRKVKITDDCQGGIWCLRSSSSTPGWTQILDGVDLVHNNYEQPTLPVLVDASDGVQFLDMNQHEAIGGLYQIVGAVLGETYNLSLDVTAWATNSVPGTVGYELYDPTSMAILANGSFSESVINHTWDTVSLSAKATSNKIGVRIQGISAFQAGMGVDNVILTGARPMAAAPEPASWALMILGFGSAGALLRRRRRDEGLTVRA